MADQQTSLEAVAGYRSHEIVGESPSMQAFLQELPRDLQARFLGFAWHLYHEGLEDGISRRSTRPTEEQMALLLIYQASIFTLGARAMAEELES